MTGEEKDVVALVPEGDYDEVAGSQMGMVVGWGSDVVVLTVLEMAMVAG